jgi:hypothetical protein
MRKLLLSTAMMVFATATVPSFAASPSKNGKYYNLKASYECWRDEKQYGSFYDYGYWKGGRWCGRYMPSGFYVYKNGTWYIWSGAND